MSSIAEAEAIIADPANYSATYTETAATLNYINAGTAVHFDHDQPFPGTTLGTDADNFVILATGNVIIPTTGDWTFGVNSDDGFAVTLTGPGGTYFFTYDAPRALTTP